MKKPGIHLIVLLSLGLGVSACDSIGDATDTRENEEFKDAAENVGSAMEKASENLEEAVE